MKTFTVPFFCPHKTNIGWHLWRRCQILVPIPMAVFGTLGQFEKTRKLGSSPLISLEFSIFIISTSACLNLLSKMGSINYFGKLVQEILQNNYLKTNFENSNIRDFVSTFWNFIGRWGVFLKKIPCFLNFKCTYLENYWC